MTAAGLAVVLGVAAALAAARGERRWAYGTAKAVASAGFIGLALAAGAGDGGWSRWALAALVLSGAGDVVLSVRARWGFLGGLGLFLVAHAVYVVAFSLRGVEPVTFAAFGVVVALPVAFAWRRLGGRLPSSLRGAVWSYVVVVSAMAASGLAVGVTHGAGGLAIGAVLVVGSDLAVARERFGRPGFVNKAIGLPTYYAGQALIAASLGGG